MNFSVFEHAPRCPVFVEMHKADSVLKRAWMTTSAPQHRALESYEISEYVTMFTFWPSNSDFCHAFSPRAGAIPETVI